MITYVLESIYYVKSRIKSCFLSASTFYASLIHSSCVFHVSNLVIFKITFESSNKFQNTLSLFPLKLFELQPFIDPIVIVLRNYISKHKEHYKILGNFIF